MRWGKLCLLVWRALRWTRLTGRLLRVRGGNGGYQFQSIGPDRREVPLGKRDWALTFVGSPEVPFPEGKQELGIPEPCEW